MATQEGHLQHFNKPHARLKDSIKDSSLADLVTLLSVIQSPPVPPSSVFQQSSSGAHRSPVVSTKPLAIPDGSISKQEWPTANGAGEMDVDNDAKTQNEPTAGSIAAFNGVEQEMTGMRVDG